MYNVVGEYNGYNKFMKNVSEQILTIRRYNIGSWVIGLVLICIGIIGVFGSQIEDLTPRIFMVVMGLVGIYVFLTSPFITIILDKTENKFIFKYFSLVSRRKEEMPLTDIKSLKFYKRMQSSASEKYNPGSEIAVYIPVFVLQDNTEFHISPKLPISFRLKVLQFKDKIISFLDIPYEGVL